MGALSDEKSRKGMSEVVKAQVRRQARLQHRRLEVAAVEVVVPQRTTLRRGEDKAVRIVRSGSEESGEVVPKKRRERDGAPMVVLG